MIVGVHSPPTLFIRGDKGSVFQGLIIDLQPIGGNGKIVEKIVVPILPNKPQAKENNIMPVKHFIKAFVSQHRPGGGSVLRVKASNIQTINLGTSRKQVVPEILDNGALKEDVDQVFSKGVTDLTSRIIDYPYSIQVKRGRESVMLCKPKKSFNFGGTVGFPNPHKDMPHIRIYGFGSYELVHGVGGKTTIA